MSIGGGPGTSGMMNAVFGQSPCVLTSDGLVSNPNRWTEHHNMIFLDHVRLPLTPQNMYDLHICRSPSESGTRTERW